MRLNGTTYIALLKLKRHLEDGNDAAVEQLFQQVGVDELLSEHTLDVVRARNEVPLVVFLASVAEANNIRPVRSKRWRLIYQSLAAGTWQNELQALPQDAVLRFAMHAVLPGVEEGAEQAMAWQGNDAIWGDALELLIDRSAWLAALQLVQRMATGGATIERWSAMADRMLRRYNLLVSDFEQAKTGVDYGVLAQIFEIFARAFEISQAPARHAGSLVMAARAWEAGRQYEQAMDVWQRVPFHPKYVAAGELGLARCQIKLGRFEQALRTLDASLPLYAQQALQPKESADALDGLEPVAPKPKTRFNVDHASQALSTLVGVMAKAGLPCFLVSGTLLGYVREGQLLAHDKDLDIGVLGWEKQYEIMAALLESGQFKVLTAYMQGEKTYNIPMTHVLTGTHIDMFIYHPRAEDNKWVTGVPFNFGYTQTFAFTPFELREVEFLGVKMFVPADAERNLRENFGEWRTPDTAYISHLESPSTDGKGDIPHQITGRLMAYKALKARKATQLRKVAQVMAQHQDRVGGMAPELQAQLLAWAQQCDLAC